MAHEDYRNDGAMIGTVTLDQRDPERKGNIRRAGAEAELGYMLLRPAKATT